MYRLQYNISNKLLPYVPLPPPSAYYILSYTISLSIDKCGYDFMTMTINLYKGYRMELHKSFSVQLKQLLSVHKRYKIHPIQGLQHSKI